MSTKRYAGHKVHGKGQCRWCGEQVTPPRRSWCGDSCVQAYLAVSDPKTLRKSVLDRDAGVCGLCGRNCVELEARIKAWLGVPPYSEEFPIKKAYMAKCRLLARLGISDGSSWRPTIRSLWQADHILPVCEGGGECGLENLRTLCSPCHKKETKALAKRRAEAKRKTKVEERR